MLKAPFILEIFVFLSDFLGTPLDKKVNFKIYDITDWTKNNYNTHITQYLKKTIR